MPSQPTDTTATNSDVVQWLRFRGTCLKCCQRFLHSGNHRTCENGAASETAASSDESVCNVCLGLLQEYTRESFLDKLSQQILASGYDFTDFALAVSLPISAVVRDYVAFSSAKNEFPGVLGTREWAEVFAGKDVWRSGVASYLERCMSRKFNAHGPFLVTLHMSHSQLSEDCQFLSHLCHKKSSRYHRKKTQRRGELTKPSVVRFLDGLTHADLSSITPCPPACPDVELVLDRVEFTHSPIFIGGRYLKLSRQLSQTPWVVDGERRLATSVQELICGPAEALIRPDEMRFSSSGREDIDVRCLGGGRPFLVEFVNPRHAWVTGGELEMLCERVNGATDKVEVRQLQLVDKDDTSRLKEGEEEKKKTYSALCYTPDKTDFSHVKSALESLTNLTLHQKTPVRVLHRRTSVVRERTVHWMWVCEVDAHHFRLEMCTQAGTYVKEFVHGDLGRTRPSVGQLIHQDVDIIELDVTNIDLEWPPNK